MSVIYGSYYSIHQGKDVVIRSLCHSVPPSIRGGEVSPQREHTNAPRPRGGGVSRPARRGVGHISQTIGEGRNTSNELRVTKKNGAMPRFLFTGCTAFYRYGLFCTRGFGSL